MRTAHRSIETERPRGWILLAGLVVMAVIFFAGRYAHGQVFAPGPCPNSGAIVANCVPAITTSGGTVTIPNLYGGYNASFEEIFTGSPATVSVTVQGCARGGTCDTAVDTNTSGTSQIRFVTFSKAYGSIKVTANWTGGTNVTFQAYPIVTTARTGSGSLVNATFDLPNPVVGQNGLFQYKIQSNGLIMRVSCSTDQGTAAINLDLRTEGSPNATGTSALGSDLTCNTTTGVTTTIANAQYLANAPIALLISGTSGTPSVVRVHVASVSN